MQKIHVLEDVMQPEGLEPDHAPAYEVTFDLRTGEMEWEDQEGRQEHHNNIADVIEAMPASAQALAETPAHEVHVSVLDAALVAGALAGKLVYEKAKGLFQGEEEPQPAHEAEPSLSSPQHEAFPSLNPDPTTTNQPSPMPSIAPDPHNRLEQEGPSPATMGDSSKPPSEEHDLSKESLPKQDFRQDFLAEQGQQPATGGPTQEQGEFKPFSLSGMKEQTDQKFEDLSEQLEQERNQEQENKQQQTQSR